ncbi:hypothetical protein H920_10706 [Fukomys damarensis]|uniref:Uncharacterized protein n=1 Tax=Fukomys damarensis TaxID=885580 RepID=A0A091D9Z6_FUKDA|nr:hypothetical protein H920_10706 [Fukomys damarensis]
MKAAAIPSDTEVLSSSDDGNNLVHIRKTIGSQLLLENQQAKIFLPSALFMAVGNTLQVDPPGPDCADSAQLGVTT